MGRFVGDENMKKEPLELFRLSPEIWKAMNYKDIMLTAGDMDEMGLMLSPYSKYAIETPLKFIKGIIEQEEVAPEINNLIVVFEYEMRKRMIEGVEREEPISLIFTSLSLDKKIVKGPINTTSQEFKKTNVELQKNIITFAWDLRTILVVLLATKNSKIDKIANRNLLTGKSNKKNAYRKNYAYTTTISIGAITENHCGEGDDPRTMRPHLRRGHIRTQKYGPNFSMEKKIFIDPVFVNASEGFIQKRSAYNVSLPS